MRDQSLMYDEVPVVGTAYKMGDWKTYARHTEECIHGFFGDYVWLSNFYRCQVWYEGATYPSSENAYQAAKVLPEYRIDSLTDCSPAESKKEWKKYPLLDKTADEWNARKYDVMASVVFEKFNRNVGLRNKLLKTGRRSIEETNHWHDNFYGRCICEKCKLVPSQNNLGKILTKVREFWK